MREEKIRNKKIHGKMTRLTIITVSNLLVDMQVDFSEEVKMQRLNDYNLWFVYTINANKYNIFFIKLKCNVSKKFQYKYIHCYFLCVN